MKKLLLFVALLSAVSTQAAMPKDSVDGRYYRLFAPTTFYHDIANQQLSLTLPDSADSTAVSAQEEVTGVINKLYAAAAKNEADIDSRFACHEWCAMVAAVNEKDSQEAEIGFFNDDYWTEMQDDNPDDLEARDIKFEKLDDKEGTALVDFTLYSSVQTVHMKFCFCRDDGKWRVHDIIRFYPDEDGKETSYSLMEAMREYLE